MSQIPLVPSQTGGRRRIRVAVCPPCPITNVQAHTEPDILIVSTKCGRCRKRKVRCSGESHDGTACSNCQLAGVSPILCVFMRVRCESRELLPDHMRISWTPQQSGPPITTYQCVNPQDSYTHDISQDQATSTEHPRSPSPLLNRTDLYGCFC